MINCNIRAMTNIKNKADPSPAGAGGRGAGRAGGARSAAGGDPPRLRESWSEFLEFPAVALLARPVVPALCPPLAFAPPGPSF